MLTQTRTIGLVIAGLCLAGTGCSEMLAPFRSQDRVARAERAKTSRHRTVAPQRADADRSADAEVNLSRPVSVDSRHYYSQNRLVMIRRPDTIQPKPESCIEVRWTNNNGFRWQKAGIFKPGQNFFPFEVEEDGDYGIRFVRLDRTGAKPLEAGIDRIYHVDRTEPHVKIAIEPERDEYHVGEIVTLHWQAEDLHPAEHAVRISLLPETSDDEAPLFELQRDLANSGSIQYEIPPKLIHREITFRIEAEDLAKNRSLQYSCPLPVEEALVAAETIKTEQEIERVAVITNTEVETSSIGPDSNVEPPVYAEVETSSEDTITPSQPTSNQHAVADESLETQMTESLRTIGDVINESIASEPIKSNETVSTEPVVMATEVTNEDRIPNADCPETPVDDPEPTILISQVLPFATAVARLPQTNSRLVWEGAGPGNFPDSRLTDSRRTDDGLFSDQAKDGESEWIESTETTVVILDRSNEAPRPMDSQDTDGDRMIPDFAQSSDSNSMAEAPRTDPAEGDMTHNHVAQAADTPTTSWTDGGLSAIDLTRGSVLMIPLPATVEPLERRTAWATAHPWRVLGNVWSSPIRTIWALGEPRLYFGLKRAYRGRFLADNPILRTVTAPAQRPASRIAGLPEEDAIETLSDTGP